MKYQDDNSNRKRNEADKFRENLSRGHFERDRIKLMALNNVARGKRILGHGTRLWEPG